MEISPLRLPLSRSGLVEHGVTPGAPIPGVLNDVLAVTQHVRSYLKNLECFGPVSTAAADAVERATARLGAGGDR